MSKISFLRKNYGNSDIIFKKMVAITSEKGGDDVIRKIIKSGLTEKELLEIITVHQTPQDIVKVLSNLSDTYKPSADIELKLLEWVKAINNSDDNIVFNSGNYYKWKDGLDE